MTTFRRAVPLGASILVGLGKSNPPLLESASWRRSRRKRPSLPARNAAASSSLSLQSQIKNQQLKMNWIRVHLCPSVVLPQNPKSKINNGAWKANPVFYSLSAFPFRKLPLTNNPADSSFRCRQRAAHACKSSSSTHPHVPATPAPSECPPRAATHALRNCAGMCGCWLALLFPSEPPPA